MIRQVEPEILDSLSPWDPQALANRKDMRVLNHIMGNFRWIARALSRLGRRNPVLELGAGDGSLGLYLLRRGIVREQDAYAGVDLIPRPEAWPDGWTWYREDLTTGLPESGSRILVANLILHQFVEKELSLIGSMIEDMTSVEHILICEPVRRKTHLWQLALTRAIGMKGITLHDGKVSIRAGFRGLEVCRSMGLTANNWSCRSVETFLGANRILCQRL